MNRSLTVVLAVAAALAARPCAQEPSKAIAPAPVKTQKGEASVGHGNQPKEVEGRGTGGNSWFQSTDLDFGSHHSQDTVIGRFRFSNPLTKEVEWRGLQGSCQCSTAVIKVGDDRYRYTKKPNPGLHKVVMQGDQEREESVDIIKIPAGATGEVEVHMELGGQAGLKSATLDIHTTDVPGQQFVTVRVNAAVLGPLEIKPGTFLPLGRVKKGARRVETITFEPNDATDVKATAVKIENLTIDSKYVTATTSKDGKKLVVELVISEDTPTGLLRGDLVVELDHPAVPSRKILFNGFVR